MRCSYAVVIFLCATGCTKGICSRNSECATGFVCTAYGTCGIAPDASSGDASDQPGETPTPDAGADMQDAMAVPTTDGEI